MALTFHEVFIEPILTSAKTVTRRDWKKAMLREGGIYKAKVQKRRADHFALLKVTKLYKEELGEMTDEDAAKEGFESLEAFKDYWINDLGKTWEDSLSVFVIEFELDWGASSIHMGGEEDSLSGPIEQITGNLPEDVDVEDDPIDNEDELIPEELEYKPPVRGDMRDPVVKARFKLDKLYKSLNNILNTHAILDKEELRIQKDINTLNRFVSAKGG